MDPSQLLQTDPGDPLKQFSPEQILQILRLGSVDDRQKQLQEQMTQAQGMQSPSYGQGHSTPAGASFGGLADLVSTLGGIRKEHDLRGQQGALTQNTDSTMAMLAEALRNRGGGQGGAPAAPPPPGGMPGAAPGAPMYGPADPNSPDELFKAWLHNVGNGAP